MNHEQDHLEAMGNKAWRFIITAVVLFIFVNVILDVIHIAMILKKLQDSSEELDYHTFDVFWVAVFVQ